MADALELSDDDFSLANDAPPGFRSVAGRTQLFTVLFVTAFVLLVVQFIVPQFLAATMMPAGTPTLFNFKIEQVQAAQAVWWEDRLWVTVTTVVPGSPPVTALRALNADGRWDRQSDLMLSVPFERALVEGDRLFLISNSTVTTIQDRQVRTTYPRLKLNQPSAPFVTHGQLSILDRLPGQADVVWYDYQEGEWTERGRIAMPAAYHDSIATITAVRSTLPMTMQMRGGRFVPIFAGGANEAPLVAMLPDGRVWVSVVIPHGQLQLWSTVDPALQPPGSATESESPANALSLNDPAEFTVWTEQKAEITADIVSATFDGEPIIIEYQRDKLINGFRSSAVNVHNYSTDGCSLAHRLDGFSPESQVPLVKPKGTLLFLAATPLSPTGLNVVELTKDGFSPIRRMGDSAILDTSKPSFWSNYLLMSLIPLVTATILGLVAHVMVERHRDRRFSFGHHTVKLASILRRSGARVVDMLLFSAPMMVVFGMFWAVGDVMAFIEQRINENDFQTLLFWGMTLVLGSLLYLIVAVLIFGTMEGLWGLSPGKWLFHIRVVRTTFQPIGLFRGMIRQFLLMIDGQFHYFVAIMMAACMPKSQRLGDLCADSIVVEKDSLPPGWPRKPPVG